MEVATPATACPYVIAETPPVRSNRLLSTLAVAKRLKRGILFAKLPVRLYRIVAFRRLPAPHSRPKRDNPALVLDAKFL